MSPFFSSKLEAYITHDATEPLSDITETYTTCFYTCKHTLMCKIHVGTL